ncbi:MAG TPA: DUF58 domain-containing protein [Edaphobacter sp.]|jgi:uncharacterized protein (DUF58 family)|nr:DUF58 domain-containing protein [Edaphobacter sp.]
MQTLIAQPVSATARYFGIGGRLFGFGLTARALLLLISGVLWAIPTFFHPHRLWMMLTWDGLMGLLILLDAQRLPAPSVITVMRQFLNSPTLGERTEIEYEVVQQSSGIVTVVVTDELHPALIPMPRAVIVVAYPRDAVRTVVQCYPGRRGDFRLGKIYLRYRGTLGLVERWSVCDAEQDVRVFPASEQSGNKADFFLMRARQIELQKRRLRLRGIGREFESLRDYQQGDELRNISWTATARRAKLITRQFTTERSQQVWIVLDAGRLSRTAFELRRERPAGLGESEQETAEKLLLSVTQLDQATSAAVMLAQVIGGSGDKFALLSYGRRVQQQLLPGNGPVHLRMLISLLSQVRSESAEANHLQAASRLKNLQRRRGLVVWITEIAESAGRPEVVSAVAELVRRHLVILVLLEHPEVDALAAREPKNAEEMFATTAAQEMLERRREAIARLRQQGVLVVETTPAEVGARAISKYLEVKAQGLL